MTRPEPSLARELEAALAWWQAAGVDCDFADDATAWLAEAPLVPEKATGAARRQPGATGTAATSERRAPVRPASPPETRQPAKRNLLGESPPDDLAAFREWWLSAPGLDTAHGFPRIAPRGNAGAPLMVLVPYPEEGDRGALLEGPQGRLLTNILAAMGLAESEVYLASALPCHTPMADLAGLAAGGMDAVTTHHIAVVAPQRLLVFGTGLAPMLAPGGDNGLREINHTGGKLPVMLSETLDTLLDMPRLKARFWRRWMEWSATH
jgi:DNA polymerase